MQHRLRHSGGLGERIGMASGSFDWSGFWDGLQSAIIYASNPDRVVLTFTDANITLVASDFALGGYTITSLTRDVTNKILTLVCTGTIPYSTTVTLNKGSGYSATVIKELEANTDVVEVGGYPAIISSGGTVLSGKALRFFINKSNTGRIRANTTISRIQLYTENITDVTAFFFQLIRKDGTTYDVVAEEDILSKIAGTTVNTVTLTTPMAALEGDFMAVGETASVATVSNMLRSVSSVQTHAMKYEDGDHPAADYAWDSKTSLNLRLPLKAFGNAPMTICIGDSIVSGSPANDSFITDTLLHDKLNSFPGQLEVINALYNPQNMGYPSQTTTQILARFTTDCINEKPRIAVLEGGVNDINGGVITKATFLANWTSMLDACETAGIIPVVCKILPWTNGSNAQMQTRDDWMTDLEALVATYTGSVWVDFDSDIGKFRAGGDDGNLWDIQTDPDYDYDGVHLTQAGYTKMAEIIDEAITQKYSLI